uniref:(northern house mosquito) hypothetical protein n=1 Tax=Culex pipiens TaxID=7175 RepID=A0A8D8J7M7_CULPI
MRYLTLHIYLAYKKRSHKKNYPITTDKYAVGGRRKIIELNQIFREIFSLVLIAGENEKPLTDHLPSFLTFFHAHCTNGAKSILKCSDLRGGKLVLLDGEKKT